MVFRYLYPALAYDFDVLAFRASVQGFGGTVSDTRMAVLNTFVTADKTSDAWGLTDEYWFLWGEDAGATGPQSLTGLKQRRLITAVASPVGTNDRGYVFNGTTNYLNTNFVPSVNAIKYTGTNQRVAVYERTNLSSTGFSAGMTTATNNRFTIRALNAGAMAGTANNNAGTVSFAVTDSLALKVISRASGGTTAKGYDRGVALTDATGLTVGTGVPAVALYLAAHNNNGTTASFRASSLGFAAIGAPLSATQELAQYNAVQAFATSVGANV